jgi:aminomethyltransferase
VTLSRFGEHGGYEVWCRNDDALVVWDRIVRAGLVFGLQLAGVNAMDTLDIEAGVSRPWRDYAPARDASGAGPTPRSLALESLIDSSHHAFNGYRSWQAASKAREASTLAGVVIDGTVPVSFSPLLVNGRSVGRTLSSRFSPALHRAIALAELDVACGAPGTQLSIVEPGSLMNNGGANRIARVVALPFLPSPGSIPS